MRKPEWKYITIVFAVVLMVYALILALHHMQPTIANGNSLSTSAKRSYLVDWEKVDAGGYECTITDLDPSQYYSVMLIGIRPGLLWAYDENMAPYAQISTDERLYMLRIPEDLYVDGTLRLTLEADEIQNQQSAYLCAGNSAADALRSTEILRGMLIGFMMAMAVYGFTLYFFKRSEQYLIAFSVYALCMFTWGGLLMFRPFLDGVFDTYVLRRILHDASFLLPINAGLDLMERQDGASYPLCRKRNLIFWATLIFCLPSYITWSCAALWYNISHSVLFIYVLLNIGFVCSRLYAKNCFFATMFVLTELLRLNSPLVENFCRLSSFPYYLLNAMPIPDMPYVVACMYVTNRLFAKKFAESEEDNILLDRKVAARTEELEMQQQQKHQLMINVFHDLRSPLFIAKGCIDIIRKEPDKTAEHLGVIEARMDFMARLTDDLFFIAKLENDTVIFSTDHVDLGLLLEESVSAYTVEGEKRCVELRLDPCLHCMVEGDRFRLQQAFGNLVQNAITYTNPGTTVDISMRRCVGEAHICIRDHGKGIRPEDISNIFLRYYTADRNSKEKSTGLGLSIAQQIIAHHEGRIKVESQPGCGASFTVCLPLL